MDGIEMEQAVGITAKLREVRDTMRRLHGDKYQGRVWVYRQILECEMERAGCSAMLAAARVLKDPEFPKPTAMTEAMVFSAAVEIIESIPPIL